MTALPTVGILMRTCQRPPVLLRRALASVAAQSHQDWRLLILNNGRNTSALHRCISDSPLAGDMRVTVECLPDQQQPDTIIHEGLVHAGGRVLAMHDDDDAWAPDFLSRTLDCLERSRREDPGVVAATCWISRIWECINGDLLREVRREAYAADFHAIVLSRLCRRNFLLPLSLLMDRDAYLATGGFRKDLAVCADWEFYLRLAMHGRIAVEPSVLAYYHVRTGSAADGSANTVTSRLHDHQAVDARIRAEWWQREPNGLGMLLQLAALEQDALDRIESRTSPLRRAYDQVRSLVVGR